MSTDSWRAPLASLLWLLVFACAEAVPASRESATAAQEPAPSQTPDPRATPDHMKEYEWYAGLTGVDMGSTSGRVCFLTQVVGNFGTDRYVGTYIVSGKWILAGYSIKNPATESHIVSARARCSNAYSYTAEYSWTQGQNAKLMGSIYGRSCFLTRVGGQITNTTERVEVYSGNTTSWWLGGSSQRFGVHGRARCVLYPPQGAQQPYTYTGWVDSSAVLQLTSWKCYVAGIRGRFSESSAKAAIFADAGFWKLAVSPMANAKVGCTR